MLTNPSLTVEAPLVRPSLTATEAVETPVRTLEAFSASPVFMDAVALDRTAAEEDSPALPLARRERARLEVES